MKQMKVIMLMMTILLSMTACTGESNDEIQASVALLSSSLEALEADNAELADKVQVLEDTDAVRKVANNLFIQTDNMDWEALVNDVFTENVYFDMTSVGGTAGDVSGQSIVEGWEQGFAVIESVHHQSGNMQIEVDGETATVFQYGTATQYATTDSGNNTRTFIGTYEIGLTKEGSEWKVNSFAFDLKIMDGNVAFE